MSRLRKYRDLPIDWDMTPEDAVALYLEWGNNGYGGGYQNRVTSKNDFSNYFVVYTWDENPKAFLIRRNSDGAQELAELDLPPELGRKFLAHVGNNKGVYPPNEDVKTWLKRELYH